MTKRNKNSTAQRIEKISGILLAAPTYAGGFATQLITPVDLGSYSPKLLALSDLFQFYRFTKLRVTLAAGTPIRALGVGAGPLTTAPANNNEIRDLPWSMVCNDESANTTPYGALSVPHSESVDMAALRNSLVPWYRIRQGAFDANLQQQGYVVSAHSASSGSAAGRYYIHYSVEFKDFIGVAQTPMKVPSSVIISSREKESSSGVDRCSSVAPAGDQHLVQTPAGWFFAPRVNP